MLKYYLGNLIMIGVFIFGLTAIIFQLIDLRLAHIRYLWSLVQKIRSSPLLRREFVSPANDCVDARAKTKA